MVPRGRSNSRTRNEGRRPRSTSKGSQGRNAQRQPHNFREGQQQNKDPHQPVGVKQVQHSKSEVQQKEELDQRQAAKEKIPEKKGCLYDDPLDVSDAPVFSSIRSPMNLGNMEGDWEVVWGESDVLQGRSLSVFMDFILCLASIDRAIQMAAILWCNIDVAVFDDGAGYGAVIRDHQGNLTANGFGLVTGFRLPIASRKKLRCMKIDYKLELQCHGLSAMILDNKVESWCKMELAPECSRPATGDGRRSALDTHRITGKGMAPLTAPPWYCLLLAAG
nr:uncharacterized protein LOC109152486 [Ipomoea batatas]